MRWNMIKIWLTSHDYIFLSKIFTRKQARRNTCVHRCSILSTFALKFMNVNQYYRCRQPVNWWYTRIMLLPPSWIPWLIVHLMKSRIINVNRLLNIISNIWMLLMYKEQGNHYFHEKGIENSKIQTNFP